MDDRSSSEGSVRRYRLTAKTERWGALSAVFVGLYVSSALLINALSEGARTDVWMDSPLPGLLAVAIGGLFSLSPRRTGKIWLGTMELGTHSLLKGYRVVSLENLEKVRFGSVLKLETKDGHVLETARVTAPVAGGPGLGEALRALGVSVDGQWAEELPPLAGDFRTRRAVRAMALVYAAAGPLVFYAGSWMPMVSAVLLGVGVVLLGVALFTHRVAKPLSDEGGRLSKRASELPK